jgi:hypothetical protein
MLSRRGLNGVIALGVAAAVSSAVAVKAQPQFTVVGSIAGPADRLDVQGRFAYLAGGKTLAVVDISNPASPKRAGTYESPEKIWGFRVIGSLVYLAADFFGLGILEVDGSGSPALRGSIKTPGQAKNVAVVGTHALVADHMSGVDHIDVSNVAKPVNLGSFFLDGYARDVVSTGSMAYAVDAPTGLYIFDLSKPGPLEAITSVQTASAPGSIVLADTSAAEGLRLALLVGGGALQVYDISSAAAPARIATFKTPSGRPLRARLSGRTAYVADGREGLQVVDLSTPSAPRLVGGYKTTSPARDVAVANGHVFVATGAGGEEVSHGELVILRQTP